MTMQVNGEAGRVAMISGASRGIGLAIAKRLMAEGYRLSLGVRHDTAGLPPAPIAALATGNADRVWVSPYEATDRAAPGAWVQRTVEHFGRLDVLVNNAGILRVVDIEEDQEEWLDELWEVNVKAPLRLIRHAFPHLRASGTGRIINMVSLSGQRVMGRAVGYAMSKAALLAMTHTARHAGWNDGVRATAVCPGWVNTDMTEDVVALPHKEMTQPDDIASSVAMLLSLPNNASVAEFNVNCRLESKF